VPSGKKACRQICTIFQHTKTFKKINLSAVFKVVNAKLASHNGADE